MKGKAPPSPRNADIPNIIVRNRFPSGGGEESLLDVRRKVHRDSGRRTARKRKRGDFGSVNELVYEEERWRMYHRKQSQDTKTSCLRSEKTKRGPYLDRERKPEKGVAYHESSDKRFPAPGDQPKTSKKSKETEQRKDPPSKQGAGGRGGTYPSTGEKTDEKRPTRTFLRKIITAEGIGRERRAGSRHSRRKEKPRSGALLRGGGKAKGHQLSLPKCPWVDFQSEKSGGRWGRKTSIRTSPLTSHGGGISMVAYGPSSISTEGNLSGKKKRAENAERGDVAFALKVVQGGND